MHTLKIFAVGPLTALAAFCVLTFPTQAQPPGPDILGRNLIVPQSGVYHGSRVGVQIEKISADIRVVEQVATTRLTIKLLNKTKLRQEAEILLPVPNGVSVRDFSFEGPASEPTARLLPKEEAERIYGQREDLHLCANADEALDGADVLAVVTEWIEFRSPDFQEVREKLNYPAIFDGRNIYDPQAVTSAGLIHYSIGRRPANPA